MQVTGESARDLPACSGHEDVVETARSWRDPVLTGDHVADLSFSPVPVPADNNRAPGKVGTGVAEGIPPALGRDGLMALRPALREV